MVGSIRRGWKRECYPSLILESQNHARRGHVIPLILVWGAIPFGPMHDNEISRAIHFHVVAQVLFVH